MFEKGNCSLCQRKLAEKKWYVAPSFRDDVRWVCCKEHAEDLVTKLNKENPSDMWGLAFYEEYY